MTGFLLDGEDVPTVHLSGDNASMEHVRATAERVAPVDAVWRLPTVVPNVGTG